MKKKIMIVTGVVILMAAMIVGVVWRNNDKLPEKNTKEYLDQIFTNKESDQEEELAKLFMNRIRETQLACALDNPGKHEKKFFADIKEGLAKEKYQLSVISRKKDEVKIKVTLQCFQVRKIVENAQSNFTEALKDEGNMSEEQMSREIYKFISREFQKGPENDEKVTVTVTLHKKNHKWKVDKNFEKEIIDAMLQS